MIDRRWFSRLARHRATPALAALLTVAVATVGLVRPGAAEETTPGSTPLPSLEAAVARVDGLIAERLAAAGVTPAERTSDEAFLRRLTLDLLGTVPSPDEVRAFVADRAPDKRAAKIDELLEHEAFAEYQGMVWYRTLTGLSVNARRGREGQGARYLGGEAGQNFHKWLSEQIASNRPYDEMVFDMITASGRTDENGAAVYLARWEGEPNNTAGAVTRNFLGLKTQCAQCHDHIYEETWKQSDFKGMASFFATTRINRVPEYRQLRDARRKLQEAQARQRGVAPDLDGGGEGMPGDDMAGDDMTGEGMDGDDMAGGPGDAPRGRTPDLARLREQMQALRELGNYASIVEVSETPVRPRMIAQLERRMRGNENPRTAQLRERLDLLKTAPKLWHDAEVAEIPGIGRRYLLGRWVTSEDNPYFARTLVNRMWATYLGHGFVNPVDDWTTFAEPSHPTLLAFLTEDFKQSGHDLRRLLRIILGTEAYQRASRWTGEEAPDPGLFARAVVRPLTTDQLPFALVKAAGLEALERGYARRAGRNLRQAMARAFTFVFDDDEGAEAEDFEGSIPQALFLMNGRIMQGALSSRRGMPVDRLLRSHGKDADRIEHLYLTTYGREPTRKERDVATRFLKQGGNARAAYEDLLWALLNSAEFMTNH